MEDRSGGSRWGCFELTVRSNLLVPINFIKHIIAAAGNLNYEEDPLVEEQEEVEDTKGPGII